MENQQDMLLHPVHLLIDLHIDTLTSDLTIRVNVMGSLAPMGHAKERSYVEKRSRGS